MMGGWLRGGGRGEGGKGGRGRLRMKVERRVLSRLRVPILYFWKFEGIWDEERNNEKGK